MDVNEQYVVDRLRAGEPPASVEASLVRASWPQSEARAVVGSAQRLVRPGGWWALIAAAVLGAGAIILVIVLVASALSAPGGPRAVAANLQDGAGFLPLLAIPAPLWLVMTGLVVTHVTAYRGGWARARAAGLGRRGLRMSLLVVDWILVGIVPLAAIGGLIVLGVTATALGVMCGEAQSPTCGL